MLRVKMTDNKIIEYVTFGIAIATVGALAFYAFAPKIIEVLK
jgi:hypothetical protein